MLSTGTHRKASVVLRRQCFGSAHQPPAGDHTPESETLWCGLHVHQQASASAQTAAAAPLILLLYPHESTADD